MGWDEFMKNAGDTFVGTAAALDQFGQHQLGPAMASTTAVLNEFGRDKLGPAVNHIVGETGKALDEFGKHKLGPALATTGAALNEFGEKKLGPALAGTAAAIDEFGRDRVVPVVGHVVGETSKALDEFCQHKLGPALGETGKWVKDYPIQTAVIGSSFVTLAFPGIFSAPFLWIFGWGRAGVRAGSAAAVIQSSVGNVAARGTFATLQSASAGGYGVTVVHGIVRAGAAVFGSVGLIDAAKEGADKESTSGNEITEEMPATDKSFSKDN